METNSDHSGMMVCEQPLSPTRGLVTLHTVKGRPLTAMDVCRWLRINRVAFRTEKVDVLTHVETAPLTSELLEYAQEIHLRLSLRTDGSASLKDLVGLKEAGLHDVFLTPRMYESALLERWGNACRDAGVPLRLQIQPPFAGDMSADVWADQIASAGTCVVNVTPYEPFFWGDGIGLEKGDSPDSASLGTVPGFRLMLELVKALTVRGIEANLLRVPFCLVEEPLWPHVFNMPQFFHDHQQYHPASYALAEKLYQRGPILVSKSLLMLLGEHTLFKNPIDDKLLPWLLENPWLRARIAAWHKLTRHLRLTRSVPRAIPENAEAYEREIERIREETQRSLGPICGACRLRRICDRDTPEFKRAFPGLTLQAQPGELVVSPMHFATGRKRYYDTIDAARCELDANRLELARIANDIVNARPPDREIDSYDYAIEGQWCHQLPGGVRWYGFTNTEKVSTPLAMLHAPFTIAAVFGGGIAEYIGFSLGRHCKIVCPMEEYRHRLVLYVNADGRYVLLRDGKPVRPVEFETAHYTPSLLGTQLEPRLSIWNIDGTIVTQNVMVWNESLSQPAAPVQVKYSVVIVCMRYARRLQICLQNLAHQHDFDLAGLEVIVAYVPGLDATEDVLDSIAAAYPQMRIVRSTFSERYASAKGFLINESLRLASGEWVVLLDADTLVPPNLFAVMDGETEDAHFIAPDGRKLVSPETTARILVGDIKPWESWQELLKEAGEFRYREMDGVPIGFCQCVRRSCFDKVRYYEVDHFEGADWQFSVDMYKYFGKEKRLSGLPVLHLDHGGSKWYGADRHF